MRIGALAALLLLVASVSPSATPGGSVQTQPAAQQRYDEARALMQQQRYADAAAAYRKVADRDDAAADLRAQALFASGLLLQNARDYERAAATYREVVSRFPGTLFARRAEQVVRSLEEAVTRAASSFAAGVTRHPTSSLRRRRSPSATVSPLGAPGSSAPRSCWRRSSTTSPTIRRRRTSR